MLRIGPETPGTQLSLACITVCLSHTNLGHHVSRFLFRGQSSLRNQSWWARRKPSPPFSPHFFSLGLLATLSSSDEGQWHGHYYTKKKRFYCNSLPCEDFVYYFPVEVLTGSSGPGNVFMQCTAAHTPVLVHAWVGLDCIESSLRDS